MLRYYISLSLAILALSGCNFPGKYERFRGMAVLGPHGPEFYPEMEFRSGQEKISPWRMSGIGKDFRPRLEQAKRNAAELGLSSFPWITVEFLGEEITPSPKYDGPTKEVRVVEWVKVEPCTTMPDKCLDQ
jgi:hypothetical protein